MTAPAMVQSPPTSVETYTFSFDVPSQRMKFRLGDEIWLIDELWGSWEVVDTDASLRFKVRCKLTLVGGVAYVWTPRDADLDAYAARVPAGAHDTCYRLCANKPDSIRTGEAHWRLRDERTGYLFGNDIRDYQGVMRVHYKPAFEDQTHAANPLCNCRVCDSFRHIYHTGPAYVDGEGVAHFAL